MTQAIQSTSAVLIVHATTAYIYTAAKDSARKEVLTMDVREKLIEILRKPIFPHELVDPTEAVADYLLDSGVTVQEWISVDDELPKGE